MLQIWRKIYMSCYIRKTHRIKDNFATDAWKEVQDIYREAIIEIEPDQGHAQALHNTRAIHLFWMSVPNS
jgi:hypothetical protein